MNDDDRVGLLQRMVDGFAGDVEAVQVGVADTRTPDRARAALAAALIYVVERFDLVPDHIEGLGVADDAAVLRLAAKHAVSYGANDAGLRRLAGEAVDLGDIYEDLVGPLEDYLGKLQWKAVDGKTPADTLADTDSRVRLWKEIGQTLKAYKPHPIVGGTHGTASMALKTLRKLVRARLQKAGLVESK